MQRRGNAEGGLHSDRAATLSNPKVEQFATSKIAIAETSVAKLKAVP